MEFPHSCTSHCLALDIGVPLLRGRERPFAFASSFGCGLWNPIRSQQEGGSTDFQNHQSCIHCLFDVNQKCVLLVS